MLPALVEKTMYLLCSSLNARISNIESVYLYGSVALKDYIEGSSDIDFLAIVRNPLTQSDIQAIVAAHEEVEVVIPNTGIMGAYILFDDLENKQNEISSLLTYYDKQINTNGLGADINPITWWILKKHGIKIYGTDLTFNYDLEIASLLEYVISNLNSYWVNWINRLEKKLSFDNLSEQDINVKQLDKAVEWCTLGMLRQLYTLKEHDITSKIGSGNYGITELPEKWNRLIHEAIAIKRLQTNRYYKSQIQRLTDLLAFLRFIHLEANHVYNNSIDSLNYRRTLTQ
ncbi:DUF4111 domain-containing protein [Paenibacillus sp. WQ 127069]|uniref:DUF4111 domain-containing protein n=1 Tax=Paenibacillus baimaensis TaxID=2982185 RepID=A0ABT2UF23_9BACL|nr:nucleotidyltransferase domain-containing protein [Paenibacillus sp. WQ 127069]MCU6793244.1 DUF4111 domain-containing protein [Paenibacillus sp. WQ 127069]